MKAKKRCRKSKPQGTNETNQLFQSLASWASYKDRWLANCSRATIFSLHDYLTMTLKNGKLCVAITGTTRTTTATENKANTPGRSRERVAAS